MIAGGFVLLRFIGQLMHAKRNMEAERAMHSNARKIQNEREETRKKFGKTNILANKSNAKLSVVLLEEERYKLKKRQVKFLKPRYFL